VARRVGFGIHTDWVRRKETERLHGEIRNRDADVEHLRGEVQIRDAEIGRLAEEHRAVLASRSWRLTAPARSFKTWINNAIRVNR
jgi:hypothetical protein